ncbi:MAG TPA: 3-carboxy-cis,cis-muconate cycloisomerase [Candidatus Dormibacteraeota bacterium]|nr:3-carboxy-cis,cis-muconate cycloisomerase [Candidatus Dormibacteraeota bacterium]
MPSDALFGPSLSTDLMLVTVSDRAWVQAMLDVEAALARAESRIGLIPAKAADGIASHCRVDEFDVAQLGKAAVRSANPVIPLVNALRAAVPQDAAPYVHRGATSQDILDTAMMLIARRGLDLILADLEQAAAAAAALADRHRATVMAARTLLQQALPTTFGLKAAGWLVAIVEARSELIRVRRTRLAVQFGGAAGTMAALSDRGLDVARELAAELALAEPTLPWHTARARVVEVATALGIATGVAGKVALDVVLLAQTEVGEISERSVAGRGTSSTLPQKHNPVDAIEILAAVRGINAQVAGLQGAMVQEHERAAGAWQAEWPAFAETLRLAGGAVFRLASLLAGLQVDPGRMRRNLDLSGGRIMAEHVVMMLGERVDQVMARVLVDAAISTATSTGRPFKDVLRQDPAITTYLKPDELAVALDPAGYLGVAGLLIDRALAAYRAQQKGEG